jgi:integrase
MAKSNESKTTWVQTKHAGVRYREHPTRNFKRRPDRYIVIRYNREGKLTGEAVGWETQGANFLDAVKTRNQILQNIRHGEGYQSLKEKRGLENTRRDQLEEERLDLERENIPLDVFAEKYLEWAQLNKKSWRDDKTRYYKHIAPLMGKRSAKEILVLDIERLKQKLSKKKVKGKPISQVTVKHCLVLVRQIFNRAIGWGLFQGPNPVTSTIKAHKGFLKVQDNKRLRFLSHEDARSLLAEVKKTSEQTHDICLLSLQTGMRMGEIFSLKWQEIDLKNGIIHIRDAKNNHTRQAYITPTLNAMFSAKENPLRTALVFPARGGGRISQMSDTFDRAVNKQGLNKGVNDRANKIVPHSLRHSFASWLAMQGENILVIKELLGHKDLSMTQRYAHLLPDTKRQAVERLALNQEEAISSQEAK